MWTAEEDQRLRDVSMHVCMYLIIWACPLWSIPMRGSPQPAEVLGCCLIHLRTTVAFAGGQGSRWGFQLEEDRETCRVNTHSRLKCPPVLFASSVPAGVISVCIHLRETFI